jgi:hypothetical protein
MHRASLPCQLSLSIEKSLAGMYDALVTMKFVVHAVKDIDVADQR